VIFPNVEKTRARHYIYSVFIFLPPSASLAFGKGIRKAGKKRKKKQQHEFSVPVNALNQTKHVFSYLEM